MAFQKERKKSKKVGLASSGVGEDYVFISDYFYFFFDQYIKVYLFMYLWFRIVNVEIYHSFDWNRGP